METKAEKMLKGNVENEGTVKRVPEFDDELLLRNITAMIQARGMKVGEVETAVGVSTGYFSRVSKRTGNSSLGVNLVWKVAKLLDVPLDVLTGCDLSKTDDNSMYMLRLLSGLIQKTCMRTIQWDRILEEDLDDMLCGERGSRLHVIQDVGDCYGNTHMAYVSPFIRYTSYEPGDITPYFVAAGNWYTLQIDTETILYITHIRQNDDEGCMAPVFELYLDKVWPNNAAHGDSTLEHNPLCCSWTAIKDIKTAMERLYKVIGEHQYDIRLSDDAKLILDRFML